MLKCEIYLKIGLYFGGLKNLTIFSAKIEFIYVPIYYYQNWNASGHLEEPRRGAERAARRNGPGTWDDSQDEDAFEAQIEEIEGNAASSMADAGFKTLKTPCDCPCCEVTLTTVGSALEHFRTEDHATRMQSNLDELGEQIPEDMRDELRATIMFVKPTAPARPVDAFSCLQRVKAKNIARPSGDSSLHVPAGQGTPQKAAPTGQTSPAPGTQAPRPVKTLNSTIGKQVTSPVSPRGGTPPARPKSVEATSNAKTPPITPQDERASSSREADTKARSDPAPRIPRPNPSSAEPDDPRPGPTTERREGRDGPPAQKNQNISSRGKTQAHGSHV
jgi:hypothetical protein